MDECRYVVVMSMLIMGERKKERRKEVVSVSSLFVFPR